VALSFAGSVTLIDEPLPPAFVEHLEEFSSPAHSSQTRAAVVLLPMPPAPALVRLLVADALPAHGPSQSMG